MKKLIKYLAIGLVSLVLLIVAAAIIVPLVVDVDKYRSQITQAADQHLNGKLELGKLSLSLWGQIRVQVQGLSLADTAGRKVVTVNDAYFHLPFLSILSGSPEMIFKMERPEVNVIQYKNGKLNVMNLMKPSSQAPVTPGTPGSPSSSPVSSGGATEIPGIVAKARLGVELRDALVNYSDELTGLKSQVKNMNLVIKNISLSHTMDFEMWADLDTTLGKTLAVHGPARLTGHAKPEVVHGAFDHATVDAKLNLDDLDIVSGEMFHKSKGMAAHADLAMIGSAKEAKIEHFDIKFFNAEITSSGAITHLGTAPVVQYKLSSNAIDLKSWNQLVPMLKEYDLSGTAKLDADAAGPSDKLGYKAKFTLSGLTAKAPRLKAEPRFDAVIDVVTDQIQNMQLTMKAPGNEMTFKGKLVSFTQPQGTFELTSSGMDLDQLIDWPPPAPAHASASGSGAANPGTEAGAPVAAAPTPARVQDRAEVTDASLDSLRANPALAHATLVMNTQIKMLKAKNIKMTDLTGKLYLRDLTAGIDSFAMRLWNGTVKLNLASQLKPKTPTYTFSTVTDSLELKEAVAANVAMFKNTVVGKAHFEMSGAGASFNTEPAKQNLKAKGSMRIENATFGTIDVAKMASDALNKAIERVGEKIPQAKGKNVGLPAGTQSKYQMISSSFTISEGKFNAPDFSAKAAPNQGIDLKGSTQVGLKDYALATTWDVIDTYNLLKARDISVDVAGSHIDHLLAEGNGPVKFTVHAGCNCFQPCYSYTEVPEQIAKVALKNVTGAATDRAKSEVRKKIESVIPKSAPPAVQDAIQGLGKKLFGN